MTQALLASMLMSLSILLIVIGFALSRRPAEEVASRLDRYGTRTPRSIQELELEAPFTERVIQPMIRNIAQVLARMAPQALMESQRQMLEMAGNPNHWSPADFLGVRGLAALICAAIPAVLFFLAGAPLIRVIMFSAGFGVLGFMLPVLWLRRRIRERQTSIVKTLPDALDLLTISVEAGLGFDAALAKVAEKWDIPLSHEFGRVIAEVRLGRSRRQALLDMANRVGVEELQNFVSAINQAEQLGVSIGKILRVQSEDMRIRRRQRAEEAAHKAPIKMLFPMAFLLFPAIFLILLGPAVPRIMEAFSNL
ncbi:MAG: type II secretion system F family protein [Ardenticatenia bacterium]|nr:type II secretion system F family protein [Ardenticatenia bacterium]